MSDEALVRRRPLLDGSDRQTPLRSARLNRPDLDNLVSPACDDDTPARRERERLAAAAVGGREALREAAGGQVEAQQVAGGGEAPQAGAVLRKQQPASGAKKE
jgi:hypothetical protein